MSEKVKELLEAARELSAEDRAALIRELSNIEDEPPIEETKSREELVMEICGKYAHLPGSADEFIQRKREDLERENTFWR
ncbi:MAG: hypothetical protein FJW32_28335 [Acidobacteria bacterium]|nr:hypothetical protein [Acidobacteriota bacterium]